MANEILINGKSHRYSWLNTIFLKVEDFDLIEKVSEKAQGLDCDLEIGKNDSYDVMAVPFFVGIVDRTLIDPDVWEEYLDFRLDVKDKSILIVVDIENGIDSQKTKNLFYTDSNEEILSIIYKEKKRLNRIEFIYYNHVYNWLGSNVPLIKQRLRGYFNRTK